MGNRKEGVGMTPSAVHWISGRVQFPLMEMGKAVGRTELQRKTRTSVLNMFSLRCLLTIISYL